MDTRRNLAASAIDQFLSEEYRRFSHETWKTNLLGLLGIFLEFTARKADL